MIKLSTVKTEYITDNQTFVKCILKTKLTDNKSKDKNKDKPIGLPLPPFVGIAHLHKEDEFNYEVGCRIALAKAERIAYKRVGKGIAEEYKSLTNLIKDLDDFIYKAESMVKHNTEYIKKLSNCSEKE